MRPYERRYATPFDHEARENANKSAEGVGFEPTEALRLQRFSRPPHSTALPPLRCGNDAGFVALRPSRQLTAIHDVSPLDELAVSGTEAHPTSAAISYLRVMTTRILREITST